MCYKIFPYVLVGVIIITGLTDGIIGSFMTLFSLGFWMGIIYCIILFFKLKDSKGRRNADRATYEFISITYVTLTIIGFIIGTISGFTE